MFEWIRSTIESLGYFGVAALTLLENVFPPIPSELVIPMAGFVAAEGRFRLDVMIAAASCGSLAGATFWYAVGRTVGEQRLRQWIAVHGKWVALGPHDIDRAQNWFHRHGAASVCLGRVVPGVRTFVSIPAGVARMPIGRFMLYSSIGTLIWTTVLAIAGRVLQSNFGVVGAHINVVSNTVIGAFVLLMLIRYYKCWVRARAA
jgi:membrane protein DedA with SNARE-associated domain